MDKFRVIVGIIVLVMGSIHGSAQEIQSSEQEKIDSLMNKFWSLRYGDWGSLSQAFKEIGDPVAYKET
jgi:hypothetical protein